MGGRGGTGTRNSEEQSVTTLQKYTGIGYRDNIRKDFNLSSATNSQIDSISRVFSGILEYDKGYDENRTPFNVTKVSIQRISEPDPEELKLNKRILGRSFEDKTIQLIINTEPKTDSAYIKMVDSKYRRVLIGSKGGYFTYDRNGKKKTLSSFDVRYGSKDL